MKNTSSDPPHLHPVYCQSVAITPPPGRFLSHFLIQNPICNPRAIKILRTGLQSAIGLQSATSFDYNLRQDYKTRQFADWYNRKTSLLGKLLQACIAFVTDEGACFVEGFLAILVSCINDVLVQLWVARDTRKRFVEIDKAVAERYLIVKDLQNDKSKKQLLRMSVKGETFFHG